MTYSNTYSSTSSPTNFIPFSGMGMRKGGRATMMPSNYQGDGSTLSLDFTTGVLDPRLTFSRASTATFVNSSGYVQFANANLMTHSENCGSWGGAQSITATANVAIAPNGTLTADQLNFGSVDYFYNVTAITNPVGQQYVGSVWMRTVSGTASVGLRITNINTGANSSITTCSVTETWQRFNTSAFTLTDTANRAIDVGVDQRSIVSGPGVSANIYIWGLQLQPGASVGEYLPTTTTQNYSTPRFDYSPTNIGQPRGLLIESQAVNKAINSETFASAFYIPNTTTLFNETTGTNPAGTVGNIWFAPTSNGDNRFLGPSLLGVSTTSKVTYSVWLKAKGTNRGAFLLFNSGGIVNSSGVVISQPANASASFTGNGSAAPTITNLSSTGWTRVAITTDAVLGGTGKFEAFLYPKGTSGQTTNDSLHIWGAQIEETSGASSYIPTGASGVTRNEDSCVMTGTNFSSWSNSLEGTFLCNFQTTYSGITPSASLLLTFDSSGSKRIVYLPTGSILVASYDGTNILNATGTATGVSAKVASSYNQSNKSIVFNGGTVATGVVAAGYSSATSLGIGIGGTVNAHFKQIKFYPIFLTNTQLQTLTTP